jgi:hypothetical protein
VVHDLPYLGSVSKRQKTIFLVGMSPVITEQAVTMTVGPGFEEGELHPSGSCLAHWGRDFAAYLSSSYPAISISLLDCKAKLTSL